MMLLSSGVNFGFTRSLPHILGISCGFFAMLLAIYAGFGKVFEYFPAVYQLMKIIGFLYLVYLAYQVAKSGAPTRSNTADAKPINFLGAALFQWVNPKAWMMAVSFMSSYMPPSASIQFGVGACLLFSLINCPCVGLWALAGTALEQRLANQRYRAIFNRLMAVLLILSMLPVLFM